jgi:hypothetical protein
MEGIGRFGLSIVAAAAAFVASKLVLGVTAGAVLGCGLGLALWFATGRRHPVMRGAMLGAGWCGIIGFVGGYFGPIYLSDSNLGPLLGLFITGPGGFVVGALCGAAIAAGKPG